MKRRNKGEKRPKASEKEMNSFMVKGADNVEQGKKSGSKSKKGTATARPC